MAPYRLTGVDWYEQAWKDAMPYLWSYINDEKKSIEIVLKGAETGEKLATTRYVKKVFALDVTKERILGMMSHAVSKKKEGLSEIELFMEQHQIFLKMKKAVKNWNLEQWITRQWVEQNESSQESILISAAQYVRKIRTQSDVVMSTRMHDAMISVPGWDFSYYLMIQNESEKYLRGRSSMWCQHQQSDTSTDLSEYTTTILSNETKFLEASLRSLKDRSPDIFNDILITGKTCFINSLELLLVEEARSLLQKREIEKFSKTINVLEVSRPEIERNVEEMVKSEILEEGRALFLKYRQQGMTRKIDGTQFLCRVIQLEERCREDIPNERLQITISHAMKQICDVRASDEYSLRSSGDFVTCSELLCQAVDKVATNRSKITSKKGLISLMRYVGDHSVFLEKIRRDLAKRLLTKNTIEVEEEIFSLMQEVGVSAALRVCYRTMLDDKKKQVKINSDYQQHLIDIEETPNVLDVFLITGRSWPSFRDSIFDPPPPLSSLCDTFTSWWSATHKSQHLKWLVSVGKMTLIYDGKTELNLSTSQGTMLLCFNDSDGSLKASELCTRFKGDRNNADRILRSLVVNGLLKVSKEAQENTMFDSDAVFSVVVSGQVETVDVAPPVLSTNQLKKQKVENQMTRDIRTAILRVAKASPEGIREDELVESTIVTLSQLPKRTSISPDGLSHMIRSLVETDYLKRWEEDPQVLQLAWESPKRNLSKNNFAKEDPPVITVEKNEQL